MSNSIFRYHVTYNFCNQKEVIEYKDFQNAAEKTLAILNEYKYFSEVKDSICIRRLEYASERNLKNGFSLQERPIWSNGFHNVEDLKVLAGKSNKG